MIPQTVPFVKMEYYTRNTLEFWKTWQFFGGIHAFATDSKKHAGFCRRVCPEPAFCGNIRQYRTKSVWRLCTPSACKFPFRACFVSSRTHLACIFSEIFRENTRKSTKDFLRFSLHLSKNLTTQSACVRYETDSHISQKCSWIHQVFTPLFVSSDEKFDDASVAQSLCGIA